MNALTTAPFSVPVSYFCYFRFLFISWHKTFCLFVGNQTRVTLMKVIFKRVPKVTVQFSFASVQLEFTAKAQWTHLRLPSCGPGLESQGHHNLLNCRIQPHLSHFCIKVFMLLNVIFHQNISAPKRRLDPPNLNHAKHFSSIRSNED